jgi:hypothetical protein
LHGFRAKRDPPDPDRIKAPRIDYARKGVTITYFVEPPEGAQACPGAPPARVHLELAEPLGDRVLQDGGFVAPRQRFPKEGSGLSRARPSFPESTERR